MKVHFELNNNVIHVTHETPDLLFGARRTTHYYYDIENWLVSFHGDKGEAPSQKMSEGLISYVKQYYYPQVGLEPEVP